VLPAPVSRSRPGLAQLAVGGLLLAALAAAPAFLGEYPLQVLFRFAIALVLAEAWNLLAGTVGLVSLGTSCAFGVGGYVFVGLLEYAHVPDGAALLGAAAAGALLAALSAPGLLRLRGLYFTVGTLALAEVLRLLMVNVERFGGATGLFLSGDTPRPASLLRIAACVLAATWIVGYGVRATRASVLLRGVRDDEDVAAQFGVNTFGVKLAAFAIACALAAAAGAVQAWKLGAIEPYGMFALRWSIDALIIVILGGLGQPAGPFIGAVLVVASSELFVDYPRVHLALTGLLLIVMMRFAPRGLAGLIGDLTRRIRARESLS
jgi:branched-chain amino acid transport system permease protein